jgi:hypothetical protein
MNTLIYPPQAGAGRSPAPANKKGEKCFINYYILSIR